MPSRRASRVVVSFDGVAVAIARATERAPARRRDASARFVDDARGVAPSSIARSARAADFSGRAARVYPLVRGYTRVTTRRTG